MDGVNLWKNLLFRAQQIGINPAAFWQLSLREWLALSSTLKSESPMTKSEFETLSNNFKD